MPRSTMPSAPVFRARSISPLARRNGRAIRALIAGVTAVLIALTGVVSSGTPAFAALGDDGQITLNKSVDLQNAVTVSPGDSFTFAMRVGCDDESCIDATLVDTIPAEFAGFTINSLQTFPPAIPITAGLTGCTVGGVVTASCVLNADFNQPLGELSGQPQTGIPSGQTYRVEIQLTVPSNLAVSWPFNGVPIVNTANADALTSVNPATDNATVTVDIPTEVDVTPTKSWSPSSQLFEPGAASQFTIGAQNSSNVPATSVVVQDPAVAVNAATELVASNPFTFVDFTGLCSPSALPAGAEEVQVDLYVRPAPGGPSTPWNWVLGTPSATATLPAYVGEVGGIRLSYSSTDGDNIDAGGAASSQCIEVAQRATNRTTGTTLVLGATANNTVNATVTVPGFEPVSDTASASLTIGPLDVVVQAGKDITPSVIPAGAPFDVNLSARNDSNGPLTSLTITEPSGAPFLSADLTFTSFSGWTWPTGATAGTLTWQFDSAVDQSVSVSPVSGAPAVPTPGAGDWITGFTVTYTGSIESGTTAGMTYSVATDPTMIAALDVSDTFLNEIEVSGTNPAGTESDSAQDDVAIFFPEIDLQIDKEISPSLVTPGGTVVAELETTTSTNNAAVNPTQIVVEDSWDGTTDTDFWNAFRARELSFIQVPVGSTLTVQYTTHTPPALPVWTTLTGGSVVGGLYSNDLSTVANRDLITGFQFVFDSPLPGFSQGTIVKPNIVFEAAATLRTGGSTTLVPDSPISYDNVATADGEGESGGETIEGDEVQDVAATGIVSFGGGTGPGPGTVLSDKDWVQSNWSADQLSPLPSQSATTARTAHGWGVTVPGYDSVVLSDALPGSETTPESTVFQAFDLTGIRAVTFAQDPLLRWDTVQSIEIFVGGTWSTVPAPAGSWMNGTGFTGYNPTGSDLVTLRAATGVRLTVVPNDAVRAASTEPGRPASGSGVAWGATERPLWMQWQLRNVERVESGSKWVTATEFFTGSVTPDDGIVRNDFRVAGTATPEGTFVRDSSDTVTLLDNPPGVGIAKNATTSPATSPTSVVVPFPGDVLPADYPTVQFTVDTWNTAAARASYVRVTDPVPCATPADCVTAANDRDPDVFTGNAYDAATNPFERFTITGVSFVVPGAVPIDANATQVAVWRFDGSVDTMTMAQLDAMTAIDLADVVGIGIVYQSTDPDLTGGLIPTGSASTNRIRMVLDTQLRANLRSDNSVTVPGGVSVLNDALAQSYDPVLSAAARPNALTEAPVQLRSARLEVSATKVITPPTILETNPDVPVTVTLGATDAASTAAAEIVTISDTDAEFWESFELVSLSSATRPVGADLARVDVQLDGTSTWVQGVAVAAPTAPALPAALVLPGDLERITGIRYVYFSDPERPFSATVPSADWSAQGVFTAQLRDDVEFPGAVNNVVNVSADHRGFPEVTADASDGVILSSGVARIAVQKEPVTGGPKVVEPGVAYPWTLEFENVGTAFFDVNTLIDDLGPSLRYDGSSPIYTTDAAAMPTTGITVTQSADDNITFAFPSGAILAPGEFYRITVNITLLPGLTPAQTAVNAFTVDTGVVFATGDCVNISGNGQGVLAGVESNQCGTSNFVSPQAGALLLATKEVRGEIDGTLVDGASNVEDAALPCLPASGGFYKGSCVANTAIGATDEWRLGVVNTGTTAYNSLTFVDVLSTVGDRLLATGGARQSDWRPVFDVSYGIQTIATGTPTGDVPPGTVVTRQVTTDSAPCVGTAGGSAWPGDSVCSANSWQAIDSYIGAPEDITGVRIILDFTTTAAGSLPPAGGMQFLYRTINTPREAGNVPTAQAVLPQLNSGPSLLAWSQVGVTADTVGLGDDLRRAPQKVGVQLLTGAAAIQKTISGATLLAPDEVTVDAQCTVRGGSGGARVPVDLASFATLTVPTGGSARLDGIPLGAECTVAESGALGTFGEVERTRNGPQSVQITSAGSASDAVSLSQSFSFDNRYSAMLALTGRDPRAAVGFGVLLLGVGLLIQFLGQRRIRRPVS